MRHPRWFATNWVNLCKSHAKGVDGFWEDYFGDLGGQPVKRFYQGSRSDANDGVPDRAAQYKK